MCYHGAHNFQLGTHQKLFVILPGPIGGAHLGKETLRTGKRHKKKGDKRREKRARWEEQTEGGEAKGQGSIPALLISHL